ncbi:hypothetical protein AOXY_G11095 [Acipenser oxyrinchus oxyrinchus]|uniref:Pre-mRNA cleavage complex 2 protein Pcf11 n=1 Tax=Acipenser oxyrinchus oxyrinchus TaxID=40147 RepID=A0AAD8DEE7_ACIOX|nr:hypothetical protein AOXY_G11095 [Acipenser oxyrinchus oxyrinchus]
MSDDAAREDACQEYQSSLEDLTFNSKPHINMLTILAEENLNFAKDIVAIIEAQIAKAPATEKLPVLYLVDSIVKNVGRDYLAAFTKNLVTTFICVFEKVEENTRKSLFKLRSTWDDIFSLKKLYALDVRVNTIDPAWPIKPLPPNVNTSSIHVNPKFLNKPTEEIATPRTSAPQIPATTVASESPKDVSQEQIIRQQLLAKQKQLIELQQKKLELELEQTKAQLAATQHGSTTKSHVIATSPATTVSKSTPQATVQPENTWPVRQHQDAKIYTRDPRLNRSGQQLGQVKDSVVKKESHSQGTTLHQPDKTNVMTEKTSKQEKSKSVKKDTAVSEEKSKSPSPLIKAFQSKGKTVDLENVKLPEINKRDPRLRKHLHEKATDKEEEVKEKKRCLDKERDDPKSSEHRSANTRNKLNGIATKHERNENAEKQDLKLSSRSNVKKRSRSPPVLHSPKRKERRSPKRTRRSISSSPPPKIGKARQTGVKHSHVEDFGQHTNVREERNPVKKNIVQDPRRPKRAQEERALESRDLHPAKLHPEPKGNTKRWKSGWVENKNLKQTEDHLAHGKPGPLRNRGSSWPNNQRIPALHMPKQHRLSVDANLQIPEELNSASKRDLLKKANKRLSDGEISQEEFLVVAHQIKQLFQYQEEKQRSISWDNITEEMHFAAKKKPLLSTPPLQQGDMSDAEITYFEHKAKLRRTQVQHLQDNELWDATESQDDNYSSDELHFVKESEPGKGQFGARTGDQFNKRELLNEGPRRRSPVMASRPPVDNKTLSQDNKKLDKHPHLGTKNSEGFIKGASNKRGEVHRQKGRPGYEFKKRDSDPRGTSAERQKFKTEGGREEHILPYSERFPHKRSAHEPREKSKYAEAPGSRLGGPAGNRRFGGSGEGSKYDGPARQSSSRTDEPNTKHEGSSSQPCLPFDGSTDHPEGPGQSSVSVFDAPPSPKIESLQSQRFDGTTSYDHSLPISEGDGPRSQHVSSRLDVTPPSQGRVGAQGPIRCDPIGQTPPPMTEALPGQQAPPRYDGQQAPQRYDGPLVQQPLLRFDEAPGQRGQPRFDGPLRRQGPDRFDGSPGPLVHPGFNGPPQGQSGPGRFDGPPVQQTQMRFDGPPGQQVPGMFDPQGQQGPGRFDGPLGQQGPVRFDGPTVQQVPGRFNGPMGPQGPMRFDGQPGQQGPGRFDGPMGQQGSGRFDGPMGPQGPRRFDGPPGQGPMRFDGPVGQQGSVRFDGPSGQSGSMRFDGPPMQQGMPRFECPTSQPGPIRFCGPPGHQGPLRPPGPQGLQRFDGPQGQGPPRVDEHSTLCFDNQQQPSSFNMPNLRFSEPSHAYSGAPQPFQGQQNMSQVSNFNGPPGAGGSNFSNPFCRPVAPFFNPGPPMPSIGNMNTVTTSLPVGNIIPQQPHAPFGQGQPFMASRNPVPFGQPAPESHFGQVDVNDLLSKLLSTGIIKPTQTETPPNDSNVPSQTQSVVEEEDDEEQDEDQNIPDLTGFVIEDMKQRYDSVINRLYTGIQCYSCGMRFTTSQTDIYADHLDWHYRQNRSEKDISKKVTHRRWYYSLTDWIEFEEIAELEERAKSQFFEKVHEEVVQKTQEAAKEKEFQSVKAAADVVDETCEICQEQFEMYWEEDEEEWHLKDAIRVDEKTYHPSCYEDYKNTSSFVDCTPSPSTAPLENPLNISIEQEQEQSTCSSVKQETSDASSSCKEETVSEETKVKVEAETQEASENT